MRRQAATRVRSGAALLLAGFFATAGCGDDERRGAGPAAGVDVRVRVVDSAGMRVMSVGLQELPVIEAVPMDLVLLGADGREAELHRVQDPFLSPVHGLVVPNAGAKEVRFYDPSGRHVRSVGRDGDAPGEYRGLAWVRPYRGDSLAVWDDLLRRLTVLDGSGATARTLRPREGDGQPTADGTAGAVSIGRVGSASPLLADVYPDGSFLGRIGEVSVGPGDTTAVRRDTVRWARFDVEGRHLRDVVRAPDDEHFVWAEGGSRSAGPLPFGRGTEVATLGWTTVVAANDGFQVALVDSGGVTMAVARVATDPLTLTDADIAAHREEALGDLPAAFRRLRERALDATPFPERAPWHGDLLAAAGRLWLERYQTPRSDAPAEWVVFDADGMPRARVRLPPRTRLADVRGDTLVAVTTDALDVEHVTLLTWEPPGS